MKRARQGYALISACAALALAAPAAAHHELPEEGAGVVDALGAAAGPLPDLSSPNHLNSPNMSLLGNFDDGGEYRQGADEAFWGNRAILSSYDNPGGFRIVNIGNSRQPKEIGQFVCPGPQNDVSIWKDLVFVSVDSPRGDGNPDTDDAECGTPGAGATQTLPGDAWEGIRVVKISDPANPEQIAAVNTDCGSHTHTLYPDPGNDRLLIYVLSYPIGGQGKDCNAATHRKISVIAVPLSNPAAAEVVSTPDVSPAIGCHDVTVYPEEGLAAAACITESQIWDISDPVNPTVISHIPNPAINIHHSTTFSWDAKTLVIGDELGGAAVSPGCPEGVDEHVPLGALWFYDVSNPAIPVPKGTFRIPQGQSDSLICTAHNFNTVPMRSERDVLVSGWYNGGTTVVDFTDPSYPTQLGFFIADGPTENRPKQDVRSTAWSSYFYNGLIYANNFDQDINGLEDPISRGLDVFQLSDPLIRETLHLPHLNAQTMLRHPAQR